jgi:hypothetical protein
MLHYPSQLKSHNTTWKHFKIEKWKCCCRSNSRVYFSSVHLLKSFFDLEALAFTLYPCQQPFHNNSIDFPRQEVEQGTVEAAEHKSAYGNPSVLLLQNPPPGCNYFLNTSPTIWILLLIYSREVFICNFHANALIANANILIVATWS